MISIPNRPAVKTAFAIAIAVALLSCAAYAQQPPASSAAKLQSIQKVLEEYKKSGERLSDPDVKKSIMAAIGKIMPLEPKGVCDTRDARKLAEEAAGVVAKKLTETDANLAKTAEIEAAKIFAMAKLKDVVSVEYQRGNNIYPVKGTFYGASGSSVKIGDRNVALIDMLPEYRAKFDKSFNDAKRKEYSASKIQDYANKRRILLGETLNNLKETQARLNEGNGYIFAWKEWRNPKEIVDMLLASMTSGESSAPQPAESQAAAQKTETAQKTEAAAVPQPAPAPTPAPAAAAAPQPAPEAAPAATPEAKPDITYEDVKRRVDARLAEIANTCAGIDSDQGYKSALWGLTRQEVALMLANESSKIIPDQTGNVDSIAPKDGPIKAIELHYASNILVKVVVWFSIVDQEGATVLRDTLIEKYGLTDELRKAKRDAEEEAKLDKAEKADGKKKDDKKKDEKKGADPIPLELVYHWTGKITSAVVSFKASGDRTTFSEIKLVKMNRDLMNKLIKEERMAREEAQRQQRKIDKRKLEF